MPDKQSNLILSAPRSGSDFFCDAIINSPNISYFREYFNPACNEAKAGALRRCFGDGRLENIWMIMRECSQEDVDKVIDETWIKDEYNTTKENYSALNSEHLRKHFNVVCLMRKVSHTVPSSRPDYLTVIATSFYMSGAYRTCFVARELNELRSFVGLMQMRDLHHLTVLACMLQNYVLLMACHRFGFPIIRYHDLMSSSELELREHLACLSAFKADTWLIASVIRHRRYDGATKVLSERRRAFESVGIPSWMGDLQRFMSRLSPEIAPGLDEFLSP